MFHPTFTQIEDRDNKKKMIDLRGLKQHNRNLAYAIKTRPYNFSIPSPTLALGPSHPNRSSHSVLVKWQNETVMKQPHILKFRKDWNIKRQWRSPTSIMIGKMYRSLYSSVQNSTSNLFETMNWHLIPKDPWNTNMGSLLMAFQQFFKNSNGKPNTYL